MTVKLRRWRLMVLLVLISIPPVRIFRNVRLLCFYYRIRTFVCQYVFAEKPNKGLHFYRTYVTIVSVKDYYKTEGGIFMAQDKLTAKQQEILEYIKITILKKGYPPAVRDICEAVN